MRKIVNLILFSITLFLAGCGQESEELTKEEQEEIYREEVQKRLEEEQAEETSTNEEDEDVEIAEDSEETETITEETSDIVEKSNGEIFEALPMDTQIALLTPYYDERVETPRNY